MSTIIQQPGAQPTVAPAKKVKGWSFNQPSTWPLTKKLFPAQLTMNGEGASIQIFDSVGRIDKLLLFIFEAVSSLSVLLLAFGLITSQTNVQTHGEILTANPGLQEVWAWTQNIAIDMSLLGAIIRACVYWQEKEFGKAVLYTLLSGLLLFTAAIVSNIEAVMQSISGLSLQDAYGQVIWPVTVQQLTAIRSLAIVLILVAHAVQYVNWYGARYRAKKEAGHVSQPANVATPIAEPVSQPASLPVSDLETIMQAMITMNQQTLQAMDQRFSSFSVSLVEETVNRITANISMPTTAPLQAISQPANTFQIEEEEDVLEVMGTPLKTKYEGVYKEKIIELLSKEPALTDKDIVDRLGCSLRTAYHWRKHMEDAKVVAK